MLRSRLLAPAGTFLRSCKTTGPPTRSPCSWASALGPSSDALKIAAGLVGFLGFDAFVRWAIDVGGLHLLPSQICSMLSAFGGFSLAHALAPSAASQAHQALMPAVGWVGRWLPVFLVPVQVTLPTILFPGGAVEAAGLGLPGHICFLANGVATICGAAAMAFARGESYSQVVKRDYLVGAAGPPGTGDMLLWCLGPALVSTGVQMFQYRSRIAALSRVLFLTCGAVSLCNVLGTVIAGPLLGVSPEVTLAATMRCVTIPMALPTYARLCDASGAENNVALVALCAGVSGFIGFGFSQRFLSSAICGSTADPVARGIATGAAAHALGAACLVATEPEAFVWGMLSMAVSGVASAAWICACQPLRELLVSLAYRNASGRDA
ncbi:Plastidal glycolate/glycerate translocator 1, chloroplastic [Symbiodinium microadriaticum]|uniref:Plastidal glycolate/glycerate translocator 1, chloroplastic n=1 Tax=Symbiodinium microadriaticum TaxID=2951 RepID=A0A1Q9CTH5_SYMMI|nr:Plastidal glycolate/glycerate translocator 1, chloroplastic [Symbiodinium microadriaticum]